MAVFVGTAWIFAVVNMECGDLIQTQDPVKLIHNSCVVVDQIITCVADMASIKAHPQLVRVETTIVDGF